MLLCKKCNHELESYLKNGILYIRHKEEQSWSGDAGNYVYCSTKIIDCDKCMKAHACNCNTPTIWISGYCYHIK